MNRKDYMEALKVALEKVDHELRGEIIEDYEEHFENGLKYGKTEQQICVELGDINELVKELGQLEHEVNNKMKDKKDAEEKDNDIEQENNLGNQEFEDNIMNDYQNKCGNVTELQESGANQIVVKALFADVKFTRSKSTKIEVNCYHEGNRKQQMMYRFNTWQEGNCIYAEVVQENSNIGFFNFMKTPYMCINIMVPDNFPVIDVHSASGDIDIAGIHVNHAKFISTSGDIQMNISNIKQLDMSSRSGSLAIDKSEGDSLNMDSASGEIELSEIQFRTGRLHTSSGDISLEKAVGDNCVCRSQSGDIEVYDGSFHEIEAHSISGDIEMERTNATKVKANSTSGDIDIDTNALDYCIKTISGDIDLNTNGDIKLQAESISGDIDIRINNQGNGYEVNVQSISGDQNLIFGGDNHNFYKSGRYVFGNSGCKLLVKTTSGDIDIRG